MRNPVDIVAELVSRINTNITGGDFIDNGDGTALFKTCDIKYATDLVRMNGAVKIKSIVNNGSDYTVTISDSTLNTGWALNAPRYYHGTVVDMNKELTEYLANPSRPYALPIIYFPSTRKQTERPERSPIEMVADCRLIFATEYKEEWDSEQLKNNTLAPMYALFELFRNVCNEAFPSIIIDSWSEEQFYKLGNKVEGKGTLISALNDRLSGLVVDFTMTVNREFECICCCPYEQN